MRLARSVFLVAVVALAATTVSAQAAHLPLLPRQPGFDVMPFQTHASVHRYANGEMLAALRLSASMRLGSQVVGADRDESLAVVLVRTDARGHLRWVKPLRGRAAGRFDEAMIVGLADGGAVVAGHHTQGEHTGTTMMRLHASGSELWRWDAVPTGRFSNVSRALVRGNAIVMTGTFTRGRFALPGQETWASRRYMTHYVAKLDLGTGQPLWARQVAGGIEETDLALARDGTILFATHTTRSGGSDLVIRRITSDGDNAGSDIRWGTDQDDYPQGIRAHGDGFVVMVASRTGESSQGQSLAMVGFDAEGALRFAQSVPERSVMVRGGGSENIEILAPGPVRSTHHADMTSLWINRAEILRIDVRGRMRVHNRVADTRWWMVRTLRADASPSGVLVSGVAQRGRSAPEVFYGSF